MDTDRSSLELLGHFNRPKRVIGPDFDWDETDCGASEFDPAVVESEIGDSSPGARCDQLDPARYKRPQPPGPQPLDATGEPPVATVGAWRVLQWGMAVVVLAVAAGVLVEFGQGIAAEHAMRIAARAGATEATLPKATYESVAAVVGRRLTAYPELKERVQLTLLRNGVPVGERFMASSGDRISVTIAVPASAMVSGWLRIFSLHRDVPPTVVQAENQVPGRKLRSARL